MHLAVVGWLNKAVSVSIRPYVIVFDFSFKFNVGKLIEWIIRQRSTTKWSMNNMYQNTTEQRGQPD